VPTIL